MNSPMNTDGVFWYPMINYQAYWKDGKPDKGYMMQSYVKYFLARLQSMFEYKNLPDTIPAKWLEHYLLCNGNALIIKKDDKLYAAVGGHGGQPNEYYVPTKYVVANPYLIDKTFTIDDDSVLIYNDTYAQGLLPMLQRYCGQLVENDITLNIADIMARATINISAADDRTKDSALLWLKRLREGNLGVLSDNAFIEGLNIREFKEVASTLTPLIEYHQYIKASLFNELGLNSNYNMKRESINSNESQLNDDMLHPLIDDMLRERKEGIKRVNDMFGTNIEVSFSGAWLSNEIEEQAMLETMTASDDLIEDDVKIYPDDSSSDQTEDVIIDDTVDAAADDISEEPTEDAKEEPTEEPTNELVEVLENLTESVNDLTDAIEESEVQDNEES